MRMSRDVLKIGVLFIFLPNGNQEYAILPRGKTDRIIFVVFATEM